MIADMKNQEFLNKALRLLPTLKETKVEVAQTVEVYKEDSEIKIEKTETYSDKQLNKGSRIYLDFGNHQVRYLHLKFGYTVIQTLRYGCGFISQKILSSFLRMRKITGDGFVHPGLKKSRFILIRYHQK